MIEKLQQLERVKIFDLLHEPGIWKSLDINYHPPRVERLWCQLGNYRLYLHFIHPCDEGESLYHPHPWPSAIHVLQGSYETGLGFGPGIEPPEVIGKVVVTDGGMYYDMTHIDGWHYVRPIGGVCASVMLAGEPWDREQVGKDYEKLEPLHHDRVIIILNYFKEHYRKLMVEEKRRVMEKELERGHWIMIDERLMNVYDRQEYTQFIGEKGFVIKNDSIDGLCVRFRKTRVDDLNLGIVNKLDEPKKEVKEDE